MLRRDDGVTLVELVVVVGLLMVVLVPVFMFLSSIGQGEARVAHATAQNADARLGMERMARAIREANYPQQRTYANSALFDTIGANDVKFYSNANNDEYIERARFYISGTTLNKTVTVPDCTQNPCSYGGTPSGPSPVIENVQNAVPGTCGRAAGQTQPLLTYYTKTMGSATPTALNPTTDVDKIVDIYQVKITLQVKIDARNAPVCETLATTVQLRNWRG
jgi:hypothetical protein